MARQYAVFTRVEGQSWQLAAITEDQDYGANVADLHALAHPTVPLRITTFILPA